MNKGILKLKHRRIDKKQRTGPSWNAEKISDLKHQEPAVQEQFVRDTGQIVYATLRRYLPCEEDVRDCFQETFFNAFRKVDEFRGDSAVTTWLVSIARNCALSKLRGRKNTPTEVAEDQNLLKYDEFGFLIFPADLLAPDAEALLESRENQRLIHEAISSLSDIYRTVIIMKDIDGMRLAEIAETLDISLSATKVRLHRARLELRSKLMYFFEGKTNV